jgi:LPS sulfotransferase NodH
MHRALRAGSASPAVSGQGSLNDLLLQRFSTVRYLWLRRHNKVAQGISHFRAFRTDTWERRAGQPPDPTDEPGSVDFNLPSIDNCVKWAGIFDDEWGAFFQRRGITPMQLFYEDLTSAYDQSLRAVLDFLDIPHGDLPEAIPPLERQADETSLMWERKYRALIAHPEDSGWQSS